MGRRPAFVLEDIAGPRRPPRLAVNVRHKLGDRFVIRPLGQGIEPVGERWIVANGAFETISMFFGNLVQHRIAVNSAVENGFFSMWRLRYGTTSAPTAVSKFLSTKRAGA